MWRNHFWGVDVYVVVAGLVCMLLVRVSFTCGAPQEVGFGFEHLVFGSRRCGLISRLPHYAHNPKLLASNAVHAGELNIATRNHAEAGVGSCRTISSCEHQLCSVCLRTHDTALSVLFNSTVRCTLLHLGKDLA